MEAPVSRYVVPRWEQHFASTLIAMAKRWHAFHYQFLLLCCRYIVDHPPPTNCHHLSFEIHSIGADATNSNVALQSKVHVRKVTSIYEHIELSDDSVLYCDLADSDEEAVLRPSSCSLTIFPDVLPMPTSLGSLEQRAMLLKQVSCVGARTWLQGNFFGPAASLLHHIHIGCRERPEWLHGHG